MPRPWAAPIRSHNFGIITGDVTLDGPSFFNNHAGALFNSGQLVQAGLLTNEGTIAPGGQGVVAQTLLDDRFVQTQTGTFAVDVNGRRARPTGSPSPTPPSLPARWL